MQDRVCYLSKDDLFVGHYIEMAGKRIQEVSEEGVPTDLEGIVELWHIKRIFEEGYRLQEWTDAEYEKLKSSTNGYNAIIANFFNGLNPTKIKSKFELLEWTYKKTFWEIIDAYKLYRLIEPETLREIVSKNNNYLREVLKCKGIVEKFKNVIREVLLNNVNSAHIILDKFVAKQDLYRDSELHLPSNLTIEDKEQILIHYLQSDDPNVNYVRLITQIKDDKNQIRLSPKTRLFAERLEKKLNEDLLNDPRTVTTHWSFGVQFIDEEGIAPVVHKINEKGVPFLGGREIMTLNPIVDKYLSIKIHQERIQKELEVFENYILVSDRGTIGKVQIVPRHWNGWAVSQNIIKIVPADDDIAGYIYAYLNCDYAKILIQRETYGAVVDMVDENNVSSIPIPLLKNVNKQKEINNLVLEANNILYHAYQKEQEAISMMNDVLNNKI